MVSFSRTGEAKIVVFKFAATELQEKNIVQSVEIF